MWPTKRTWFGNTWGHVAIHDPGQDGLERDDYNAHGAVRYLEGELQRDNATLATLQAELADLESRLAAAEAVLAALGS
jgi:hypothetical protein